MNDYIDKEVAKIAKNSEFSYPLNMVMSCIWMLANHKGTDLKVLDLTQMSAIADYFVLASAQNPVQAEAMADEIYLQMKKHGLSLKSREGTKESDWVLLDFGLFIIHIFLESSRFVYDLDDLWKMAPAVPIPESYYFQSADMVSSKATSSRPDSADRYF